MKDSDITHIVTLIVRRLFHIIKEHEQDSLDQWRRQSDKNEWLYRRMTDSKHLAQEYRLMKSVRVERPLADMKSRIERAACQTRRTRRNYWLTTGVAAAILLVLCWSGIWLMRHQVTEGDGVLAWEIRPGQTQATLILSTGENIELHSDSLLRDDKMKKMLPVKVPSVAESMTPKMEKKTNLLITPRGGEFKIILEDGTEVWLNAESKLVYPETFGATERRVSVQGEAYFKVNKDERKPFYIETDGQLIRVYGTEFNVRSYEEDEEVYTTLVSGCISIQPIDAGRGELILAPNNQALFNKKDETTSLRAVNTEVFVSWKNGMFVFEEQNLEQIMCTLSRWYNFTYRFENEELKKTVFMGSIPRYAEFDDVIHILEKSGGIKLEMKGQTVVLSKK